MMICIPHLVGEWCCMNSEILKQYATQALAMKPFPNCNFPPSPYYRFLQVLAQNIHPDLSVELGVSGGGGSLHLALGWSAGWVLGIDKVNDHPANIDYILNRCANFHFRIGDSTEEALETVQPVDILFIDTTHTYDQTMKEYNAWKPMLSDRAFILLDDLFRPEGMEQAWEEMPEPKLRLDMLHDGAENGGGFGVVWK